MAEIRHLENREIAISQRKIIWFRWNLVQTAHWLQFTARWPNVKFLKFRLSDGRHFRNSFLAITQLHAVTNKHLLVISMKFCIRKQNSMTIDLSAAFDTVDHSTLLSVLSRRFGVANTSLEWCSSYLSKRTQTYHVKAQQSDPYTTDCSVPQGSVLGPMKFVSYTEDSADLVM